MKVSTLTSLVPASFEYTYRDTEGNEKKEQITLQLRRISFATQIEAERIGVNSNAVEMAQIFADIIADWNLYKDEAETEKFPISAEWFAGRDCPAGFFGQLMDCIFDKLSGKATASDSPNGSEPEAKSSLASAATSKGVTASV